VSEISILESLRARLGPRALIGDDCAVLPCAPAGKELLVTTDLMVEDVHFRRSTHKPADVGHKLLARGLSDIAAMGGDPKYCFVSLALPKWAGDAWIARFYDGFLALANAAKVTLAGGDLSHADKFAGDIIVLGEARRGESLKRSGAKPGHAIYVSGTLGGSALGLSTHRGRAWQRHLRPEPRLAVGRFLRTKASACMDLSDGLSIDLHRMCVESKVSAVIDHPLPAFPGVTLEHVLHGGEDYELLFTANAATKIPATWKGVPLTRIGTIVKGEPGVVTFFGNPLPVKGYDHFR